MIPHHLQVAESVSLAFADVPHEALELDGLSSAMLRHCVPQNLLRPQNFHGATTTPKNSANATPAILGGFLGLFDSLH